MASPPWNANIPLLLAEFAPSIVIVPVFVKVVDTAPADGCELMTEEVAPLRCKANVPLLVKEEVTPEAAAIEILEVLNAT